MRDREWWRSDKDGDGVAVLTSWINLKVELTGLSRWAGCSVRERTASKKTPRIWPEKSEDGVVNN